MPRAVGAAFVLAHDADGAESDLPIGADRPLVGGRRVDRQAVMPALLEQVAGDRPDRVRAEALSLRDGGQEEVDGRASIVGVGDLVELDAPDDGPGALDDECDLADVGEPVRGGPIDPRRVPPSGDGRFAEDGLEANAVDRLGAPKTHELADEDELRHAVDGATPVPSCPYAQDDDVPRARGRRGRDRRAPGILRPP